MDWRTEVYRDGKAATADRITAVLRRLMAYAFDARITRGNPLAQKFTPLRAIGGRVEIVFKLEWLSAKALAKLGDRDLTDALELALWTGARRGDLCGLRWDMIDADGWLTFEQSKTKKEVSKWVSLPTFALPPLAALLKRIKARQKERGITSDYILTATDPTGHKGTRQMTGINLNKRWQETKADGRNKHLAGLHLHDLRGTLATLLDEAGCEDKEIAAVTGHTVKGQAPSLAKYRKISRDNALRAYTKLAAHLKEMGALS
jgi:integrase